MLGLPGHWRIKAEGTAASFFRDLPESSERSQQTRKEKKMLSKILLVALFTSMVLAVDYQQREADNEAQQIQPTARFFAFQMTKTTVTVVTV